MSKGCNDVSGCPEIGLGCRCGSCTKIKFLVECGLCPTHGCPMYPAVPNDGKWSFNFTEDGLWDQEAFDTKLEAIEAGVERAIEEGYETFYVGQFEAITISSNSAIDADDILNDLSQQLDDNYGSDFEHGAQWYDGIKTEDGDLLQTMLDEALNTWLQKTDNYPRTLTVVSISAHEKWNDWATAEGGKPNEK